MPITKEVILDVKYTTSQDKVTGLTSLRAEVTRNEFIPAQVFLYQQNLDDTIEFCQVASVTDLNCYPTTAPGDGSPFFRLDYVELEFETAKQMKKVLEALRAQLQQLVSDYQILVCDLDSMFTETYNGTDC